MKILDCFSGIGGFRSGFINHDFVGFVDIDAPARKSYRAVYTIADGEELEFTDIRGVTADELVGLEVDMVTGGFPCPAFSIAGKRLGFEDTRGTLFFDLMNVVKATNPKFILAENVKGLISHNNGETMQVLLNVFDEIGYHVETTLVNSKNFGVAHNRERVYFLGVRKDLYRENVLDAVGKYKEPIPMIMDILEEVVPDKYFVTHEGRLSRVGTVTLDPTETGKIVVVGNVSTTGYRGHNVQSPYGIIPCLAARDYKDPKTIIDPRYDNRLRKLTPREYWRLQGFTDEQFDRASAVNSNSQLYKQAGNAVTTNVISVIQQEMAKVYSDLMFTETLSEYATEHFISENQGSNFVGEEEHSI